MTAEASRTTSVIPILPRDPGAPLGDQFRHEVPARVDAQALEAGARPPPRGAGAEQLDAVFLRLGDDDRAGADLESREQLRRQAHDAGGFDGKTIATLEVLWRFCKPGLRLDLLPAPRFQLVALQDVSDVL